jgi:hypothetical protein
MNKTTKINTAQNYKMSLLHLERSRSSEVAMANLSNGSMSDVIEGSLITCLKR